jgi:hypothetical protein
MEFGEVGRGNGMTTPAAEQVRGRIMRNSGEKKGEKKMNVLSKSDVFF